MKTIDMDQSNYMDVDYVVQLKDTAGKCRICLSEDVSALLSWNALIDDEKNIEMTYLDCYRKCTLLEARADDQLPQTICCQCAKQMRDAYYFIQLAKESQRTLIMELEGTSFGQTDFDLITVEKTEGEELLAATPPPDSSSPVFNGDSDDYYFHENSSAEKEPDDGLTDEKLHENLQSSDPKPKTVPIKKGRRRSERAEKPLFVPPDALVNCEICGITIAKKDLSFHRYRKHKPKTLLCEACPLTFKNLFSLRAHAQVHEKNRPRNFACDKCDQKFMTKGSLRCHAQTHQPNRQPKFQCDLCEKSFYHRGDLNEHKRVHTAERHECKICSKQYVRRIELKYHMERTHSGEMPFKCPKCEKAFKHRGALNKHLRFHEGTLYQCNVCSKEYASQSGFIHHRQTHSGLPLKCSICERAFAEKYKIKRHITSVHKVGEEEVEGLIIRLKTTREFHGRIIEVF